MNWKISPMDVPGYGLLRSNNTKKFELRGIAKEGSRTHQAPATLCQA